MTRYELERANKRRRRAEQVMRWHKTHPGICQQCGREVSHYAHHCQFCAQTPVMVHPRKTCPYCQNTYSVLKLNSEGVCKKCRPLWVADITSLDRIKLP